MVGATRVICPLLMRSRSHGRKICAFSGGGHGRCRVQYFDQLAAPFPYTCKGTPLRPSEYANARVGAQWLLNSATGGNGVVSSALVNEGPCDSVHSFDGVSNSQFLLEGGHQSIQICTPHPLTGSNVSLMRSNRLFVPLMPLVLGSGWTLAGITTVWH